MMLAYSITKLIIFKIHEKVRIKKTYFLNYCSFDHHISPRNHSYFQRLIRSIKNVIRKQFPTWSSKQYFRQNISEL